MFDLFTLCLILFNIIIILIVINKRKTVAKKLKLIDFPNETKIHKNPTPLIGGILLYINFLFYIFRDLIFTNNGEQIFILVISSLFFLIGLLDDIFNLNYKKKFLIFILLLIFALQFDNQLILQNLYFETFNKIYKLDHYLSYFLTILCLMLLINATNLSDGINGLCVLISIFWFLYLFSIIDNQTSLISRIVFIILLFLIFINIYKGKFFLGNSGSHFIGGLVGLYLIKKYNVILENNSIINKISVEEIFLVLVLPGVDMFRLFIHRLYNKLNPFKPDKNHFHHYLVNNFNLKNSLIIYFMFLITPYLIYKYINLEFFYVILAFVLFYLGFLFYLSRKKII